MSMVARVQTRQALRVKSNSSRRSDSTCGMGASTPATTVNATQGASSTHASNAKKRRVDSHFDADIDTPLTRKYILSIVKAVIDAMPGASTHQLPEMWIQSSNLVS